MGNLVNRIKAKVYGDSKKPVKTNISYSKPYVHIGCGDINLEGWINIDARPAEHVHILTNEIKLSQFADDSLGVIYLSHVLEHFDFKESHELLQTFRRKLKKNGVLLIAVPDFAAIAELYVTTKDLNMLEKALMGGQDYEYNYHKSVYDEQLLKKKMLEAGFEHADRYDTTDEFGKEIGDFSTYHVNGKLISLNIRAVK